MLSAGNRTSGLAMLAVLVLTTGCGPKGSDKPKADSTAAAASGTAAATGTVAAPAAPARVTTTAGFSTPESVLWDAQQNVWFVSNINGNPSAKDGNGFISRLNANGSIDSLHFIQAGKMGAVLNGPKGLTITGDTLWVADIDAVRAFDRHSGKALGSIELGRKAHFLNDIVAASDGTLYITDTGIEFDAKGATSHPGPDQIFAIKDRKPTVALSGAWLEGPNGITWDAAANHFVVVAFLGTHIFGWTPGTAKVDTLATGPGSHDGVEAWDGGDLVTSWADSTVFILKGGQKSRMVTGVPSPADIGLDPVRGLLAVPIFTENRVEFWSLK
jgi:sugar lactone lactonase YvrE